MRNLYRKNLIKLFFKKALDILDSEVSWFGPEVIDLLNNPENAFDQEWIEQNMGERMGGGATRYAFSLKGNDKLVWKVARPHARSRGGYTNAEEVKYFNQFPKFFPKVYMSGKKMNYNPETGEVDGTDFIDWLIVDKVSVIKNDEEFAELILKNFSCVDKIKKEIKAKYRNYFSILDNVLTIEVFLAAMGEYKYIPFDRKSNLLENAERSFYQYIIELVAPVRSSNHLSFESSLEKVEKEEIESFAKEMAQLVIADREIISLLRLCNKVDVQIAEIGVGNVGTDLETKTKFILLDINKFLI